MASNSTVAHDFYYKGVIKDEYNSYARVSLSFNGCTAKSYSTAVAMVVPTGDAKPHPADPSSGVTLVSFDSMTNTTGRHISELISASPFEVIRIPLRYGAHSVYGPDVRANYISEFSTLQEQCTKADKRRRAAELWDSYQSVTQIPWGRKYVKCKELDEIGETFIKVIDKTAKELLARNRKLAADKARQTRELKERLFGDKSSAHYLDVVRSVFGYGGADNVLGLDVAERAIARKALKDSAYCWVDGEEVKTSRHISVPLQEVRVAMKLWASGKDMRKYQVGHYYVLKYEGDEIQIGCHNIPRENVEALYEVIVGKKFRKEEDNA